MRASAEGASPQPTTEGGGFSYYKLCIVSNIKLHTIVLFQKLKLRPYYQQNPIPAVSHSLFEL